MCDSDNNQSFIIDSSMTRRAVVLTLSSVVAAAALPSAAFAADVTETPAPTDRELSVLREVHARTARAHGDAA